LPGGNLPSPRRAAADSSGMTVGNSPAPRRFVALTAGIAALSAAW
jgi:hypothetical protein